MPKLLSLTEVADVLGMSESDLKRLIRRRLDSGAVVPSPAIFGAETDITSGFAIVVLPIEDTRAPATNNEPTSDHYPAIVEDRFAIQWDGYEIRLGNTDMFRLGRHFVQSRGRAVSHEDIRDLQDKPMMTSGAIRQAVKSLKRKLPSELAKRIVAENGYYRLDLRF